jgi:hypothetical protein
MITVLVIFIICLLICFFFVVKSLNKLKKEQKLTVEEIWNNKKNEYSQEIDKLNKQKGALVEEYNKEKIRLTGEQDKLNEACNRLEKEIKEKQTFNSSLLKIREEELNRLIEEKKREREKLLEEQIKIETERRTEALNAEFVQFMVGQEEIKQRLLEETKEIQTELDDFRTQREAVNLAILREKEIQEKEAFYKIDISESDREDMMVLRGIAPQLKNREALNKLIYEVFVHRPLGEMIKRVTGGRAISGIYKVTYLKTGEAYIGKTTDIKTRWQNHIKTACGLEGAARSTFHNRLEKDGLWNYTFEILEEVPKDKLSEREKFYIDMYGTDTQMNMKRG